MWDQVFTLDKRLIGGRSQFVNSVTSNNIGKQVVETKNLHIVQRDFISWNYSNQLHSWSLVIYMNIKKILKILITHYQLFLFFLELV